MIIRGKVDGDLYKKLMSYIVSKSDVLSVSVRLDYDRKIANKVINIIMSSNEYAINDIVNNFSKEYIEKIAEKNKKNKLIFDEEYICNEKQCVIKHIQNFSEEYRKKLIYDRRKNHIKSIIYWMVYEYKTTNWLHKFKTNIIYKSCKDPSYTTYYLNLTVDLINDILSRNSFNDWNFPFSVEDIALFKNKQCLLCSETHENMWDIYCKDENEYKYFKSIGIKFNDPIYILEGKKGLPYDNYYI